MGTSSSATEHIEFPHLTLLKKINDASQIEQPEEEGGRGRGQGSQEDQAARAPSKRSRKCGQRRLQTRKRSLAGRSMLRGWLLYKIRKWSDAKLIQHDKKCPTL